MYILQLWSKTVEVLGVRDPVLDDLEEEERIQSKQRTEQSKQGTN